MLSWALALGHNTIRGAAGAPILNAELPAAKEFLDLFAITAIISIARSLKIRIVAECVETAQELAFLQAQDCDEAQGYCFSRPLPSSSPICSKLASPSRA